MAQVKRIRRAVSGMILLDKPRGFTSNAALQKVRWLLNAEKAGHTGSLDPLATGVLPLCFGEATKFSQFLLDTDKTYLVTASFGVRTSTSDSEGEVISERPVSFTDTDLEQALQSFRGDIMQVPTMFSALKYQGQPLYKYARQGITIEREARPITIFKFELLQRRGNQADFIVHCSKGTYIRTLIDDLGELLGCGGHVSKLHRTQVGPFTASQMVKPVQLDAMAEQCHSTADFGPLDALLLPLDAGIVAMPAIALSKDQQHQLQHGQNCNVVADDIAAIKLLGPAEVFIGIGQIQQGVLDE